MPKTHPSNLPSRPRIRVLGVGIDTLSPQAAVQQVMQWARQRESRTVCVCNVHSVITAQQEPVFMAAVEHADLATPDGAPVAWMLRRLGAIGQQRVSGPELMLHTCEAAVAAGESIFLYGSTEETLARLRARLLQQWPGLQIAGAISPPFRSLSAAEDDAIVETINRSGASMVWVSLGCPKQEQWMAAHRGRVQAVMLGVGAAFDFHAGTKPRAPRWMRETGLEWLHRLASEPTRLGRRYLMTNSLFVLGALKQLAQRR